MLKTILLVIFALAFARAQIASLGWCPDLVPMTNFDMTKFAGDWFEVERSSQLPELINRCAMVKFFKGPDNKWHVTNIVGRVLGFQRVIDGEVILPSTKSEEGKLNLRYSTTLPNVPSNLHVLETDYKSYSVLWNCNNAGLFNTQTMWIMTRARLPASETLQKAYGVMDKYKISKSYLITSDQTECKYSGVGNTPAVPDAEVEDKPEAPVEEAPENLRSAIILNDSEADDENEEIVKQEEIKAEALEEKIIVTSLKKEDDKLSLPSTVAEVILKATDGEREEIIKEEEKKSVKIEEPAVILPKVEPVVVAAEPIKKPVSLIKEEKPQDKKKNRKLNVYEK